MRISSLWTKRRNRVIQRAVADLFCMERLEERRLLSVTQFGIPNWIDQGPINITGAQTQGIIAGSQAVGAINAIATPNVEGGPAGNANIVYVGTVNGGIWKTTNGTDANPTWTPLTDQYPSLSVTSLVFDPTDPTFQTLWASVGRTSSSANDGGPLTGLLKTTNGGITWTRMGVGSLSGQNINVVLPTTQLVNGQQVVLVASEGGLYRSTNGGEVFTKLSEAAGSGVPAGAVKALVVDPGNPNRFYVGIRRKGVFASAGNAGQTWTDLTPNIPAAARPDVADGRNFKFSIHHSVDTSGPVPVTHNVLYMAVVGLVIDPFNPGTPAQPLRQNMLTRVLRSTDQGASWSDLTIPGTTEPSGDLSRDGIDNNGNGVVDEATERGPRFFGIHVGGQGDRHFSLVADPRDPTVVFIGGDRQPGGSGELINAAGQGTMVNTLGTTDYTGRLFRGVVQADGATTNWAGVVGTGASNTSPHADSRFMTFDQNGNILQADDGGIYRLRDPNDVDPAPGSQRRWFSVNGNLGVIEFYSVSYDSLNNTVFGGAQDNGSPEQVQGPPDIQWRLEFQVGGNEVGTNLGDGAVSAVDNTSIPGRSIHYTSSIQLGSFQARTLNASNTLTAANVRFLDLVVLGSNGAGIDAVENNLAGGTTIQFINPFVLNKVDPTRMLVGTDFVYESIPSVHGQSTGDRFRVVGGLTNLGGGQFAPQAAFGPITTMAYGGVLLGANRPEVAWIGGAVVDGNRNVIGSYLRLRENLADANNPQFAEFAATNYPGGVPRDIVLDPLDYRIAWVTDGRKIYRTLNAGQDWEEVTRNISGLAHNIRTLEAVDTPEGTVLLAGGSNGVFRLREAAKDTATQWSRFGAGLANAPVVDLRYDLTDGILLAGTKGRGAWTAAVPLEELYTESRVIVSTGGGAVTLTTIKRDDHIPTLVNIFVNGVQEGSFPADSVQTIIVLGGVGDDALVIDETNGRILNTIEFVGGAGNNTEQRIPPPEQNNLFFGGIAEVFGNLAKWMDQINAQDPDLNGDLPFLNNHIGGAFSPSAAPTILTFPDTGLTPRQERRLLRARQAELFEGDIRSFGDLFQNQVADQIRDYILTDLTPTLDEFSQLLSNLSVEFGGVTLGFSNVTSSVTPTRIEFGLVLSVLAQKTGIPLDLGLDAEAIGLSIDASAVVDLLATLHFDFAFGLDLSPGLSPSDAFYIRPNSLAIQASVNATNLNFGVSIGFAEAAVQNGTFLLTAGLTATFNAPGGALTLAQMEGSPVTSQVSFTPTGTINANLPVSLTIGSFTPAVTPSIIITADNFFNSSPMVKFEDFEELLNFNNIGPLQLLGLLRNLGTFLGNFRNTSVFSTPLPFTSGTTLAGVLDVGTAYTDRVIGFLEAAPGEANFASAQQLAGRLADALGLPQNVINLDYNASSDELTFFLKFDESFPVVSRALDLGLDLGALGGISTSSSIELTADLSLAFTFGVKLTTDPTLTLAQRFFIQDATLDGSVTLTADDIDAAARFGFVGISITDGTASGNASIEVGLKSPTDPGSTRVTLPQLLSGLANVSTIVQGPVIAGLANVTLDNIAVDGGIIPISGTASIVIDLPDITDLNTLQVDISGLDNLAKFENLSLADIIAGLRQIVSFLQGLSSFDFLGERLPVINLSVSDILDYADRFAQRLAEFEANPAGSLQQVQSALNAALGAGATVNLGFLNNDLDIAFSFGFDYDSGPKAFALDLAQLAAGIPALAGVASIVDVGGSTTVNIAASANLALAFGIDLTNPLSPTPFLRDTTGLTLTARAAATDLDFDAAIGPLGVFIRDGSAVLDASLAPGNDDPLLFSVGLADKPGGKYTFSELLSLDASKIDLSFTGAAEIALPLFFPTSAIPLGGPAPANVLSIRIPDLADLSTAQVTTPDISAEFGIIDLLNSLPLLITGLDQLLKTLQNGLDTQAFDRSLPMVGSKLRDAAQFIDGFRGGVLAKLQEKLGGASTIDLVQQALFEALGPGGLNLLVLNAATGGDPNVIDFGDVPFNTGPNHIQFDIHLKQDLGLVDVPIGFDIGIPGLSLTVDETSTFKINLGWELTLPFGISRTEGFYLDTSAANELSVSLEVRIPDFKATGQLAFLQLDISDEDADTDPNNDGADVDNDGVFPSSLIGAFTIDIKDPIGSNNRLTFADLTGGSLNLSQMIDARLTATADINLQLVASFGGLAQFPSVQANLALDWEFLNASTTDALFGGTPQVAFNDVGLNLGSFFSNLVGPVLEKIQQVTQPLQPLIDIVTARLPVVSDIEAARDQLDFDNDGKVTLLDLAQLTGSAQVEFIASVIHIINLINQIPAGAGDIVIGMGSFNLGGNDPRLLSDLTGIAPNITGAVGDVINQLNDIGNAIADQAKQFIQSMDNAPGGGLEFPILKNPGTVFNLLLGKPADIFLYDMPALELSASVDIFFPLLGPLGVQLSGAAGMKLDLAFGYDTFGLSEFVSTKNVADIFKGFFVSDRANPDGTGPDVPEVQLFASIEAFGAIDVLVASAGVGGGIYANINGNLNDPNDDGKVRVDELIDNFPLCIFDIEGTLKAGLSAFVKLGVGPFSVKKRFNIAEVTLLSFDYSCNTDDDPVLATNLGGGVLRLNMGPNAGVRQHGDTEDGDEVFVVRHVSGTAGDETVQVTAFGFTQTYSGVGMIVADGGLGNDSITLEGILSSASLSGGVGNDVLYAPNASSVTLHGGDGDDQLVGGAGNDSITGGGGNDTIDGGGGHDYIDGGDGDDEIDGGDGNDTIFGGAGNDLIDGGAGDDVIDAGSGDDEVSGGPGNDSIIGGDGNDTLLGEDGDDTIDGGGGNDNIDGGGGNDSLDGGDGNDLIEAGAGNDTISGGSGNDTINGDAGDDLIHGDDGNDLIRGGSGNDTIHGGQGNDTIFGEAGDDIIFGGAGNDSIEGGLGNDTLYGDADNDTIRGGAGDDLIFGGTGADSISGDSGNDTIYGEAGDDSIVGGEGDDLIYGGTGNDTLRGQQGNDTIFGEEGNDSIFGDSGDDLLYGGDGNDTMQGDIGNDTLFGNAGDDSMFGNAGDDLIDGGADNDIIFGGAGLDVIYGGSGSDTVFGEAGNDIIFGYRDPHGALFGFAGDVADVGLDGGDSLEGGDGDDFIRGQGGNDVIHGQEGADILFGDDGDDTIFGGAGDDIIFGGADNDVIDAHTGADLVFGDDGLVVYIGFHSPVATPFTHTSSRIRTDATGLHRLIGDGPESLISGYGALADNDPNTIDLIVTESLATDGSDIISGGDGNDTVFGGGGGLDQLFGDFNPANPFDGPRPYGQDVLIGDGGRVELFGGRYVSLAAISGAFDGKDQISGNDGGDYIFGGGDEDTIWGFEDPASFNNTPLESVSDNDVILGDNGRIRFNPNEAENRITRIFTTAVGGDSGASDLVMGTFGDDIILGGLGGDTLDGGVGNDILLGDQGELLFDADGDLDTLDVIRSYTDNLGDGDTLSGGAGSDVLIGGTGGDVLYGDDATASNAAEDGEDILLGDNADIFLIGTEGRLLVKVAAMPNPTAVDLITTTDTDDTTGGNDTLSGNAKADILIGGVGSDLLFGDRQSPTPASIANDGDDILLGDNGLLDFTFGTDTDRMTLDLIRSFEDGLGGADTLSGNAGADLAIGGTGGDTIHGDNAVASSGSADGGDILIGDNADIFLVAAGDASGGDLKVVLDSAVATVRTTDTLHPEYGGSDTIYGNAGGDIILGGVNGDLLYGDRNTLTLGTALAGHDIILGDNGALEWLSAGRLGEITGIDLSVHNPALVAWFAGGADTDLTTLDLITTEQPPNGGRDLIYGDDGRDLIFGGTDADVLYGDDGDGIGSAANGDVMFGDHGRIYPHFSALAHFHSRNFFAIDIGLADGGEGDVMHGEEGDDVMLGQQGDDRMFGGLGDDDMIGGHNVAGGYDELGNAGQVRIRLSGVDMNDLMDGGGGHDVMAGDNAVVWRNVDDQSPLFRMLTASTIYTTTNSTITANVGAIGQSDPNDVVGRFIELVDHDFDVQANPQGRFGRDLMAGGAGNDQMFGQLGDDLMQGDGTIGEAAPNGWINYPVAVEDLNGPDQALFFAIPELSSDGDDYMEGNGGDDLMYGGLGQDDLIGGSSELFGLVNAHMRPDGSDILYGGAGKRIGRNDVGDAESLGHARDADFIMGDNANIYRLVSGGQFLTFAYDNYAGGQRIVPRAMQQLDYTLGGADYAGGVYVNGVAHTGIGAPDNGAADLIYGEDGDDTLFGMTGSDILFGNAQDDDIVGGYGHDWISGGTGQDGVIGDDGLLYTSRNGIAEPLYGIAATTQQTIATPGNIQTAVINLTNQLKKTADLTPFSYDPTWNAMDDEFPNNVGDRPFADDIIFGGLGSDFLHGGSGDDAISGAEALPAAYVPVYDALGNPIGVLNLGYHAVGLPFGGAWQFLGISTYGNANPGDVLAFNPDDVDGWKTQNRQRAGEFALYDEYDPLRKILLTAAGELSKDGTDGLGGLAYQFLLNFDKSEGPVVPGGTIPGPGNKSITYPATNTDGDDAIFGGNGNDWLVGGTGRDNLYGGWGNDLLNVDDDPDTNGGLNNQPDTHPSYEDRAYGGAGRDVLIGNTGGDRLIDWVGEFNSYLVPFAPFGMATVSRTLQPHLPEFLYALSRADGADPTRATDTGAAAARNGEPAGELGLVLQKDFAWQQQTGAPADPQAGNIPGGKRDVLRSADFNDGSSQGFAADSGSWSVSGGQLAVAPTTLGGDAVSVFNVTDPLPLYYEVRASVTAVKPTAGYKANAYLIFDYHGPTDFKFAGLDLSTNKLVMGIRTAAGWQVLEQANMQLKADTQYNLLLAVNGLTATLVVNNASVFSRTFAARVDADGFVYSGLNNGMVAIGANNARGRFDNVAVQILPPQITFAMADDFTDGTPDLFLGPTTGLWQVSGAWRYEGDPAGSTAATSLMTLPPGVVSLRAGSYLELSGVLRSGGSGGFVFDYYGPDDFKFMTLSSVGQIVIGHRKGGKWVVDATASRPLAAGADATLLVSLKGTTVSVSLNGQAVVGHVFNGVVVDGRFGVLGRSGVTSFDSVTVRTDDPALAAASVALSASAVPISSATSSVATAEASAKAAQAEAPGRSDATPALTQATAAAFAPGSNAKAASVSSSPFASRGQIQSVLALAEEDELF